MATHFLMEGLDLKLVTTVSLYLHPDAETVLCKAGFYERVYQALGDQ